MNLEEKIMADLKMAMREKDTLKLDALRAVKSAILLAKTEKGKAHDLTPQDEVSLLQRLVKQRKESAAIYKQQGRMDLSEKETAEASVIGAFLPEQMTEEALRETLLQVIEETGASSIQDMGKVMQTAMKKLSGRADGGAISRIVKELLSA